jgi:MFS family permease
VIGPALGGALSFVSLRAPFIVDGLLSLAAFLAAFILLKDTNKIRPEHNLSALSTLGSVFSDRRLYLYLLMGVSGSFGFGILSSFVPTRAQLAGLEAWRIALILSVGALIFTAVSYTVGILSDRPGRRTFVIASQAVIVASGIGLVFSKGFVTLSAFYWLFCIGETVTYLLCFVYASSIFDQKHMGASMGAFDSALDLSLFIGPLVAVSVFRSTGQIEPIFLIAVLPATLAFFATAIWLPKEAGATH